MSSWKSGAAVGIIWISLIVEGEIVAFLLVMAGSPAARRGHAGSATWNERSACLPSQKTQGIIFTDFSGKFLQIYFI
jgi:hypothetical protein